MEEGSHIRSMNLAYVRHPSGSKLPPDSPNNSGISLRFLNYKLEEVSLCGCAIIQNNDPEGSILIAYGLY